MIRSPEMESPFRANNEKIVADGAELISWNDQKLCIRVWFHSEIRGATGKWQNSKDANEVEATFYGKASLAGTTIQDIAQIVVEQGKAMSVKAICSKWHEICGRTVHGNVRILWYFDTMILYTIYHILYPIYYSPTSLPHHIFSFWS